MLETTVERAQVLCSHIKDPAKYARMVAGLTKLLKTAEQVKKFQEEENIPESNNLGKLH